MINKLRLLTSVYYYQTLSLFFGLIIRRKKTFENKSVLFLSPFFPENAGYHWRVQKWDEELRKAGYTKVDSWCAVDKHSFNEYSNNSSLFMIRFLRKRFKQVIKAQKYETVIVCRELLVFNDYGDLFLEKLLRKICNNLILDIDDDLSASKNQPKTIDSFFAKLLHENGNSFRESFKYYDKFIVASSYLKEYVIEHVNVDESQVCVIPTCVDYNNYESKKYAITNNQPVLGWIGGDHNYYLIDTIIPILNKLAETFTFKLLVIGGEEYRADTIFEIENIQWSLKSEVENLNKIDIGLMPLDDSEMSKGKGGFKLIQYMGLGIVSIATAVTINEEIVQDKTNSFLIYTSDDWYTVLSDIFNEKYNLNQIGRNAKYTIHERFTFDSNKQKYLDFICVE